MDSQAELVDKMRRLLTIAGAHPQAALGGFQALHAQYDPAELNSALEAVTAEFKGWC